MGYIPIFSTIVTFVFVVAVFNRYRNKKGPHLIFWAIGLLFYGLGTLTEVLLSVAPSGLALKAWYLSGAMLTAAWLGQGTAFLLVRRRGVAPLLAGLLIAVSLLSAVLTFAAPVSGMSTFDPGRPASIQYTDLLGRSGLTIFLTIILNIYGTLFLVGGALSSAYLFWRKKVLANRMYGNILIAAGALMPAMAGSLLKAGVADVLYLSEFIGVVIMYAGFLQAIASPLAQPKKATPVTQ